MDIIKNDQKGKKKRYTISQHQLYLVRPNVWRKLKHENTIDERYRPMARRIAFMSYLSRPLQWLQIQFNRKKIKRINYKDQAPVFIIGHWRSGTTFLHNLMHKDKQFGYLCNYQTFVFTVALLSKKLVRALSRPFFPKERSQDNVKVSPYYPAEEEQPFTMISSRSGMHTFFFPRNRMYFDKYNIFKGITKKEKKLWQRDYLYLLKNISLYNDNKPLLLKNPHNTGRVKELLELFPNAKFIYLHRDPYTIFLSTLHMYDKVVRTQFFHDVSDEEIQDLVCYVARETLRKYQDDRHLVPEGNLIEVPYTELAEHPYETVKNIYKTLNLSGFKEAEPAIKKHINSVKEYKKNIFKELSPEIKTRIKKELGFYLEEFGYE